MLMPRARGLCSHGGYMGGIEAAYNIQSGTVTKSNLGIAYRTDEYVLAALINSHNVTGSIYQRVNAATTVGAQVSWATDGTDTSLGVVGQHDLGGGDAIKLKIDSRAQMGFSYSHALRRNIRAVLSAYVDGTSLASDAHKLGLALSYSG